MYILYKLGQVKKIFDSYKYGRQLMEGPNIMYLVCKFCKYNCLWTRCMFRLCIQKTKIFQTWPTDTSICLVLFSMVITNHLHVQLLSQPVTLHTVDSWSLSPNTLDTSGFLCSTQEAFLPVNSYFLVYNQDEGLPHDRQRYPAGDKQRNAHHDHCPTVNSVESYTSHHTEGSSVM